MRTCCPKCHAVLRVGFLGIAAFALFGTTRPRERPATASVPAVRRVGSFGGGFQWRLRQPQRRRASQRNAATVSPNDDEHLGEAASRSPDVDARLEELPPFDKAVEVEFTTHGLKLKVLEASVDWQELLIEQAVEAPEDTLEADPYGMAIWPSAQVLAQAAAMYAGELAARPGARVLEMGAGCGLASLTMAAMGVDVVATDFRKLPLQLMGESASRAGLDAKVRRQLFDVRDLSVPLPPADLVMAADLLYERGTAEAVAHRVAEARARGSAVLIGDVGRPNRAAFLAELRRLCPGEPADFGACRGVATAGKRRGRETVMEKEVVVEVLELPPGPAVAGVCSEYPSFAIRPEGHAHVL
mmetsp:Transcript_13966/g.38163  ORF Transcript_13966/g.38163 Transcript_13966/m.38163 type:complete len:357 (-) Transcript_13966:78-1148(-)